MSDLVYGQSPTRDSNDKSLWTIAKVLAWSKGFLAEKGSASARLDAEVLLAEAMDCERIHLYTRYEQPLNPDERDKFRAMLQRRAAAEPVAYIVGRREFLGREFLVDQRVLIPRPETEELVLQVIAWTKQRELISPRILDVGTGSGCIAISLALELKDAEVVAWDICDDALCVARENAERLGAKVDFENASALDPGQWLTEGFDIIVSNPPYIAAKEEQDLAPSVKNFEPRKALFAEENGLAFYRALAANSQKSMRTPGLMIAEMGAAQAEAVTELFLEKGLTVAIARDMAGHERFVTWVKESTQN